MLNWLKKKCTRRLTLLERIPIKSETESACLYIDHSYGLMSKENKNKLESEANAWIYAWRKVEEDNKHCNKY